MAQRSHVHTSPPIFVTFKLLLTLATPTNAATVKAKAAPCKNVRNFSGPQQQLIENEQVGAAFSSSALDANNSAVKKQHGKIVPAQLWDCAYKSKSPAGDDDNTKLPLMQQHLVYAVFTADVQDTDDEKIVVYNTSEKTSLADGVTMYGADVSGEPPEGKFGSTAVNSKAVMTKPTRLTPHSLLSSNREPREPY
jgi:hypothetical protein